MRSSPTSLLSWCRSLSSEMRKGFNPESLIWKPLGYLGDLVMLSLLWTVFSVPLVTIGPASAALYDAAVHGLRREDDALLARFFSTFRRELKEGVLSTLLWAAIALALDLALWAAVTYDPFFRSILPLPVILGFVLAFFLLGVQCWLWPTLSRFTLDLRTLTITSLRLSFGHILRSAAMAILWGAAIYAGVRYVAPLFVCPGLAAFLCTYLIEPVFLPFEEQEEK